MTVRVRLLITGRVQGVGFRWFARETAQRFGLAGWVRNLPSGAVESEAQGARETIERFVAELRTGLPFARVDEIESRDIPAKKDAEPFDIY